MVKTKKEKSVLSIFFKCIALVFCVLAFVSFFIPVMRTAEGDKGKVSSAQLVFTSAEAAQDKMSEAAREQDADKIADYTIVYSLKTSEKTKGLVTAFSALHFCSALVALAMAGFICASLFIEQTKLLKLLTCGVVLLGLALAIAAMICQGVLFGVEIIPATLLAGATTIGSLYEMSAGVMLTMVSVILTLICLVLDVIFVKKTAK